MNAVEIVMLIIGFICLCASFFIAKKRNEDEKKHANNEISIDKLWSEKEEKLIYDRISEILTNYQEEIIDSTNDQMNYMSNEKIMAIDEFSRQVVEKIESEHQEVIFMYNMLNEKEKEIKEILATPVEIPYVSIHQSSKETEESIESKNSDQLDYTNNSFKDTSKLNDINDTENFNDSSKVNDYVDSIQGQGTAKTALERLKNIQKNTTKEFEKDNKNQIKTKAASQTEKLQKARKKNDLENKKRMKTKEETEKEVVSKISGSTNMQIQKMYKEGKSILEISKALNIGQGEVKLVIALYGGRKRN